MIDPALLRSGRLGDKIFLDFPKENDLYEIFQSACSCYSSNPDTFFDEIGAQLIGATPADIVSFVSTAYELACSDILDVEWSIDSLKNNETSKNREYGLFDSSVLKDSKYANIQVNSRELI